MIGKKINQLATELAPVSTDLTIIGDPTTGVSKKITLAQLGAIFSGAVSFYSNLAGFPAVGDINVIYCAKDTQKLYLWSGSAYVEVFPSQALLDTYQLRSEKGNANGYASLDSGGKVPISQLPSSIMEYKGTWNAATNTPTLANGTGDTGDVYICNVAGTVNFGAGPLTFAVGDYVIYSGTIWQRSSGAVGTVTSVAATITGDSVTISGSPVTTSGTLALAFAGTTAQYIRGNGTLATFPSLTGFVPYTGATANVDLGTHSLSAYDLIINHTSGSGVAASITKGGSGEALTVVKSSGSGNAASITGGVTLLDELHLNTDLADAYIASATNWNAAYNDKINSAAVTGTTTKTLTLTQQDGGTITASWTDDNTDAVTSVFGRTGAVVAASGDYTTAQVTESGNLYFTNARAIASTLTGYTSGAGTITSSDSILSAIQKLNGNIGALTTGVSSVNGLTGAVTLTTSNIAEGTNLYYTEARVSANTDVAANTAARHNAVTIGTANGLSLSTQVLSLGLASTSTTGALSSTDWNTFNNKTSNTGTVTSVGLSSATSGVTIGSTPITTSGTITLAIATASGSQQGLLSSTDWTTFNNKQSALTNPVTGTGTTNYLPKFTGASTIGNSLLTDNGTNIGLGVANPTAGRLQINVSDTTTAAHLQIVDGTTTLANSFVTNFRNANDGNGRYSLSSWQVQNAVGNDQNGFIGVQSVSGAGAYTPNIVFGQRTGASTYATRMTLDASGNLGLGVTPSAMSAVSGIELVQGSQIASRILANVPQLYISSNIAGDSYAPTYKVNGYATQYRLQGYDGSHAWYTAPSGTAGNAISFTQAMTLDASGNLLVGGTSDSYITSSRKVLGITGTSEALISFRASGTAMGYIFAYASAIDISAIGRDFTVSAGTSSPTERFRIAASTGAATFSSSVTATTGIFSISAGNPLQVYQTSATNSTTATIRQTGAGGNGNNDIGLVVDIQAATDTDRIVNFRYFDGTNYNSRFTVQRGGNVGIGTTAPNSLLEVNRTITFSSIDTYAQLVVKTTSGANGKLLNIGVDETNGVSFIQSLNRGTDAMPLSLQRYGGAVLIGTTTEGFLGKLQVAGSVAITGQYNTVLPSSSFSYFDGSGQVVSSSSNASALYLDTTWNTTGNPDGIYLNVTNTASGASSKLLNLKVGNASQFSVSKAGAIQTTAPSSGSAQPWKLGSYAAGGTGTATGVIYIEINGQIYSIPALQGTP
jgi:hypothetical protein